MSEQGKTQDVNEEKPKITEEKSSEYRSLSDWPATSERRRRTRVLMTVVPFAVGVLVLLLANNSFIVDELYSNYGRQLGALFSLLGASLVTASMMSATLWYLQTGFDDLRSTNKRMGGDSYDEQSNLEKLARRIDELVARQIGLEAASSTDSNSSQPEASLDHDLDIPFQHSRANMSKDGIAGTAKLVDGDMALRGDYSLRNAIFERNRARLENELTALTRRGNLNLVLGSATTVVGIVILAYFVVGIEVGQENMTTFFLAFIPRVSLVIFIQIFAFFFLRLYRANLSEIKYFQSELTKIDHRYAALTAASEMDDKDTYGSVVRALVTPGMFTSENNGEAVHKEDDRQKLLRATSESLEKVIKALPKNDG